MTGEFIGKIDWNAVKKYPLDKRFIPVLFYLRDVENLTDVYYEELRRAPTGIEGLTKVSDKIGKIASMKTSTI